MFKRIFNVLKKKILGDESKLTSVFQRSVGMQDEVGCVAKACKVDEVGEIGLKRKEENLGIPNLGGFESVLNMKMAYKLTIGVLLAIGSAYLILSLYEIIMMFFTAFLISAALDPVVDYFQSKRISRGFGVLMVYFLVLFVIVLLISQLLPILAKQIYQIGVMIGDWVGNVYNQDFDNLPFADVLKPYFLQLINAIDFQSIALQVQKFLELLSTQIENFWSIFVSVSNTLMNALLTLIIAFFMTVDENAVENFCITLFPAKYSNYISHKMSLIKGSIGHWIRGQFNVSLVATLLSFIGLAPFGIEYSLTLAVVSGIFMIIPVFGRVFALIVTLPIVFGQSSALAFWVVIYYFLLSQIENNFLITYLMNKAVGLNPLLIIFSLLVGAQFWGIFGLVIAIPLATIISLFVSDFTSKKKI